MNATRDAAPLLPMTTSGGGPQDRGAAIRRRFEALGLSDRKWHQTTGIDRKTLGRAMDNHPGVRPGTYTAIEAELSKLEASYAGKAVAMQNRQDEPADEAKPAPFVRLRLEQTLPGGVNALVWEGTPDQLPEMEKSAARMMREYLREQADGDLDEASDDGADDTEL